MWWAVENQTALIEKKSLYKGWSMSENYKLLKWYAYPPNLIYVFQPDGLSELAHSCGLRLREHHDSKHWPFILYQTVLKPLT